MSIDLKSPGSNAAGLVSVGILPSVVMYGATGDGSTDDTAAFAAALAAHSTIYVPPGSYRVNLALSGTDKHIVADAATLRPYSLSQPTLTIGDGTTSTSRVSVRGLQVLGSDSGALKGVLINGASSVTFYGCRFRLYEDYSFRVTSSATRPSFFINLIGCDITPSNVAGAVALQIDAGASFTTTVDLTACTITRTGALHGHLVSVTGANMVLQWTNVWMECGNLQGIEFDDASSYIRGANVVLDSNDSNDIMLVLPADTLVSANLRGWVTIDGKYTNAAGTSAETLRGKIHLAYQATLTYAQVLDQLGFQDASASSKDRYTVADPTYRVRRSGSQLHVESGGDVVALHGASGVFVVWDEAFNPGKVRFGASGKPIDTAGSGSPEGVVTAPVGSTYRRTDGGAGTSFYVKESGTGSTGWVAK